MQIKYSDMIEGDWVATLGWLEDLSEEVLLNLRSEGQGGTSHMQVRKPSIPDRAQVQRPQASNTISVVKEGKVS